MPLIMSAGNCSVVHMEQCVSIITLHRILLNAQRPRQPVSWQLDGHSQCKKICRTTIFISRPHLVPGTSSSPINSMT